MIIFSPAFSFKCEPNFFPLRENSFPCSTGLPTNFRADGKGGEPQQTRTCPQLGHFAVSPYEEDYCFSLLLHRRLGEGVRLAEGTPLHRLAVLCRLTEREVGLLSNLLYDVNRSCRKEEPVASSRMIRHLLNLVASWGPIEKDDFFRVFNLIDWRQRSFRESLTFSETIDVILGNLQMHYFLGISPPPWKEREEKKNSLRAVELSQKYRLIIKTGWEEFNGGFDFEIVAHGDSLVARVGVMFGRYDYRVVCLKGGRSFGPMKGLNSADPLDWLLGQLEVWGGANGYERAYGYDHRLNDWIEHHFEEGHWLDPVAKRAAFDRNYKDRYKRLGFSPTNENKWVYRKDITVERATPDSHVMSQLFYGE